MLTPVKYLKTIKCCALENSLITNPVQKCYTSGKLDARLKLREIVKIATCNPLFAWIMGQFRDWQDHSSSFNLDCTFVHILESQIPRRNASIYQ